MGFYPVSWFGYGSYPISSLNMDFTPSVGWLLVRIPISSLIIGLYPYHWFDYCVVSLSLVWLLVCSPIRGLILSFTPLMFCLEGFTPSVFDSPPVLVSPWKILECLCYNAGLFPVRICPNLVSTVFRCTVICVSYMFIHSCIHSMHTNIIHAWLHYYLVSYSSVPRKSVIPNVSDSGMLPIEFISRGRSHPIVFVSIYFGSLVPYVSYPCTESMCLLSMLVVTRVEVTDGISFWYVGRYPSWGNWQYFFLYVGRYPSWGN